MIHSIPPHAHIWRGVGAVVLQGGGGAKSISVIPSPAEVILMQVERCGVPSFRALQVTIATRLKWKRRDFFITVAGGGGGYFHQSEAENCFASWP